MSVNYRYHVPISEHLIFKVLLSRHIIYHLCPRVAERSFPQKQIPERNSTLKKENLSSFTQRHIIPNLYDFRDFEHTGHSFLSMRTRTGL